MSPDRIGGGPSLTSWIRSASGRSGKTGREDKRSSAGASLETDGAEQDRSLRAELAALIDGVDLGSDEAVRALRRPVLRRILLHEFGAGFADHPDLGAMLDRIASTMEADPAMSGQFRTLLAELRRPTVP